MRCLKPETEGGSSVLSLVPYYGTPFATRKHRIPRDDADESQYKRYKCSEIGSGNADTQRCGFSGVSLSLPTLRLAQEVCTAPTKGPGPRQHLESGTSLCIVPYVPRTIPWRQDRPKEETGDCGWKFPEGDGDAIVIDR